MTLFRQFRQRMISYVAGQSVFEIIWPGVSTLLGALAGGGVTLWANLQKNSQDQKASNDGRKRSIKDRSFNACVEVLKAGRLVVATGNAAWYAIYTRAPSDRVDETTTGLESALRNWYSVAEVLRLTVPPEAQPAFGDYANALGAYVERVRIWRLKYLQNASSNTESEMKADFDDAGYTECDQLEDVVLAKRDAFIEVVKTEFDDGAWSKT